MFVNKMQNKRIEDKNKNVIFIIEGGRTLGFGHFARAISVARYLRDYERYGVFFIVNDSFLTKYTKKNGFKAFVVQSDRIEKIDLKRAYNITKELAPEEIIIDVRYDHNPARIIRLLRKENEEAKISLIDNRTDARLLAHKNIYPFPEPLIPHLNWRGYTGKIYSGIRFFPLREEFSREKNTKKDKDSVVIAMGGTDFNNLTGIVMKAAANTGLRLKVVLGPGFRQKVLIEKIAQDYCCVCEIYDNPINYPKIMGSSSIAVTAVGISIYEFAYFKIPTLAIGNYTSDLNIGRILQRLGYCKFLGFYKNLKREDITKGILSIQKHSEDFLPKRRPDPEGVRRFSDAVLD